MNSGEIAGIIVGAGVGLVVGTGAALCYDKVIKKGHSDAITYTLFGASIGTGSYLGYLATK